jgi:hypothetical protein
MRIRNLPTLLTNLPNPPDMWYNVLRILIIIAIVALVFAKWQHHTPVWRSYTPPNLLYRRLLPEGHQLSADDIDLNRQDTNRASVHDSLSSFLGRHLIRPKNAGDAILGTDLSRVPSIPAPGKDSSIFLLALGSTDQPLLQLLDAGEYIQVADTDQNHAFQAGCLLLRVIAVHGSTSGVPGDWLLVEGPAVKAVDYQFRISSKTRMILLLNRPDSTALAACAVHVKTCHKPVISHGKR